MRRQTFWKEHSLSIVAVTVCASWLILYVLGNGKSHTSVFFGNAVADWLGLVVTILATKWLFEKGSHESRHPKRKHATDTIREKMHEHSLTIFLILTGLGWTGLYMHVDPDSKWGTVVSNIVSEWTQQIGLVLLTKRLFERGSKESTR
jgi:hypothetical protein